MMIGASLLLLALALDGGIGRIDGALLFALIVAYTAFLVVQSRRETQGDASEEYADEFGDASDGWDEHWRHCRCRCADRRRARAAGGRLATGWSRRRSRSRRALGVSRTGRSA